MDQLIGKYYYILDPYIFKDILIRSDNFENALKKYCIYINNNPKYFKIFREKIKETLSINVVKCITSKLIKQVMPLWGLGSYIIEDNKFNSNSRGSFTIIEEFSQIQIMVIIVTNNTVIL